jgi:TonB family protein
MKKGLLVPILVSLAVHGAVLAIPAALRISTPETEDAPLIELSLGSSGTEAPQVSFGMPNPSAKPKGVPLPAPAARIAVPPTASRDTALLPSSLGAAAGKKPAVIPRAPAPADVLADMTALTERQGAAGTDAPEAAPVRAPAPAVVEQELGWEGPGRTLLRRVEPRFPDRFSVSGVEADCEARIVVSPGGNVVRVEITRSSGYIEIDRNVEAALRQFLFSRADSGSDATGMVRFRFRLDRRE